MLETTNLLCLIGLSLCPEKKVNCPSWNQDTCEAPCWDRLVFSRVQASVPLHSTARCCGDMLAKELARASPHDADCPVWICLLSAAQKPKQAKAFTEPSPSQCLIQYRLLLTLNALLHFLCISSFSQEQGWGPTANSLFCRSYFFSAHRLTCFVTYSFSSVIFDNSWTILAMTSAKNSETDIWPKKLSLNCWIWQVHSEWEQALVVKHCRMIFLFLELLALPTIFFYFIVRPLISCILIESSKTSVKSWSLALKRCRWISRFFLVVSFFLFCN